MRAVYSHSRISSFESCPRQFRYRYVDRLPVESESIESFMGKRVHEILERLYRFVSEGRVPTVERVVQRYHRLWEELYDPERIRIVREGYTAEHYRANGERCLRSYYAGHYPFDADETLGLEWRVRFALDDTGEYRMQGVIDRLARAPDGAIEIHDFKTGARLPRQEQLDRDRQLALYQIGVAESYPGAPANGGIRLVWHYTLFGQSRTSSRDASQLQALRTRTIEQIDRIEAEEAFEPRPGPLCGWCEYRAICPAAPGGAETAAPSGPVAAEPARAGDSPQLALFEPLC